MPYILSFFTPSPFSFSRSAADQLCHFRKFLQLCHCQPSFSFPIMTLSHVVLFIFYRFPSSARQTLPYIQLTGRQKNDILYINAFHDTAASIHIQRKWPPLCRTRRGVPPPRPGPRMLPARVRVSPSLPLPGRENRMPPGPLLRALLSRGLSSPASLPRMICSTGCISPKSGTAPPSCSCSTFS